MLKFGPSIEESALSMNFCSEKFYEPWSAQNFRFLEKILRIQKINFLGTVVRSYDNGSTKMTVPDRHRHVFRQTVTVRAPCLISHCRPGAETMQRFRIEKVILEPDDGIVKVCEGRIDHLEYQIKSLARRSTSALTSSADGASSIKLCIRWPDSSLGMLCFSTIGYS